MTIKQKPLDLGQNALSSQNELAMPEDTRRDVEKLLEEVHSVVFRLFAEKVEPMESNWHAMKVALSSGGLLAPEKTHLVGDESPLEVNLNSPHRWSLQVTMRSMAFGQDGSLHIRLLDNVTNEVLSEGIFDTKYQSANFPLPELSLKEGESREVKIEVKKVIQE